MKRALDGRVVSRAASTATAAAVAASGSARADAVLDVLRATASKKTSAFAALTRAQVEAALGLLLDEQCTIPFVARYRKERTNGMDETQLGAVRAAANAREVVESKRARAFELLKRGNIVDDVVYDAVARARSVEAIEDAIGKFKTKTSSRADRARALGLDALAEALLRDGPGGVESLARPFVKDSKEIKDVEEALRLAKDVLAERAANETSAREAARRSTGRDGSWILID